MPPSPAGDTSAWLPLYVAARLVATLIAFALVVWGGITHVDVPMLLYGPASTLALALSPRVRANRAAWTADMGLTLAFVLISGDWRSPYYLMWLSSLALPATALPLRRAVWLGAGASLAYFLVALIGGPAPGRLRPISSETLAIHVSLPLILVTSLAYASDALRRLARERAQRERLVIQAERQRIAWELHDSAKQRLHAAHLLVSSLQGRVPGPLEPTLSRAVIELESASADMDASLAELRSPLEGRRLDDALRTRAAELAPTGVPEISVRGKAPPLPPLVGAHVYRIACEALTNALRHSDAGWIDVAIVSRDGRMRLSIRDDGRGLPKERRSGASGLVTMESRAGSIGASLIVRRPDDGVGTLIELDVPLNRNGDCP
jgi:signal transduction histidine kinase